MNADVQRDTSETTCGELMMLIFGQIRVINYHEVSDDYTGN